jgi:hypothetical protein
MYQQLELWSEDGEGTVAIILRTSPHSEVDLIHGGPAAPAPVPVVP